MGIQGNRYQLVQEIETIKCRLAIKEEKNIELTKENEELRQNKGLTLKNIDLTGIGTIEQINKVKEEEIEFMIAIELADEENAIEEFFDNMQVKLGLIEKVFGIKADQVMKRYPKHISKIANRPRQKKCSKCNSNNRCGRYIIHKKEEFAKECISYKE